MVVYGEGRYACPEHGTRPRRRASEAALDAGDFDNPCPVCGEPLGWELVDEDARLDPRSSYAASKLAQEHYASAWARQAGGRGGRAALPQRLRPRDAAGHAVLRASRRCSARRSSAARRRRSSRTAARCATSCTSTTWPAPTCWRSGRWPRSGGGHYAAYNVCSGRPVSIREVAEQVAAGTGRDVAPEVTGELPPRRRPAHRGLARRGRRAELGFAAEVTPERGLAEFATAPLRA